MTLLQSSSATSKYDQSRKVTRRDVHGIPPRWRFVLELHMSGHLPTKTQYRLRTLSKDGLTPLRKPVREVVKHSIQELTGYSPATIHKILRNEDVQYLRQQIMQYYDDEFQALYPDVIDAVRRGLASNDKYLEAANTYLRQFGSGSKKGPLDGASINFTAEDMVFQILNQRSDSERSDSRREEVRRNEKKI